MALAFITLMVSQLVMIGTTSTSTLYLHDHGHPVGTIGLAASLHLGGMYVSSPLSGWLSDRFGRLPTIGAGIDYSSLGEVRDGEAAQSAYLEAIREGTAALRRAELRAALSAYCRLDTEALVRLVEFFGRRS